MKLAFIHGEESAAFLPDILAALSQRHEVKVIASANEIEIYNALKWADVAWLEWGGVHSAIASRMPKCCKLILRIHSYEVFKPVLEAIKWEHIDLLLFVSPLIRNFFLNRMGKNIPSRIEILHNGVDTDKFTFRKNNAATGKVACVCLHFNPEKQLPFVLQCFNALVQHDPRLTLHFTGKASLLSVDQLRTKIYLQHMIQQLNLKNKVFFEGNIPASSMSDWLEDKEYLISGSLFESFGYSIAEAMSKGIKPLIHNYCGADYFFPKEFLFNTQDECLKVFKQEFDPVQCRNLILEKYSLTEQIRHIEEFLAQLEEVTPINVRNYWENRYRTGGNSGSGSYGRLAEFKAETLNAFVKEHQISRVLELGCGDGNQLALAHYPSYEGYDIAPQAVQVCTQKFRTDASKKFHVYTHESFQAMLAERTQKAELSLSLDVIFHLVEDNVFDEYMQDLFSSSEKYVIIYASNEERPYAGGHMRYRKFTKWISQHAPQWTCLKMIKNKYPYNPKNPDNTSIADFYIFGKK